MTDCSGDCVDLDSDLDHCGMCDEPCTGGPNGSVSCDVGECVIACDTDFGDCDDDPSTGCEIDLTADPDNCGACGQSFVEECNGSDDDCDGLVDFGCPDSIGFEGGTFLGHNQYGNPSGGTGFIDICPQGSAIYRFNGQAGGNIDRLRGHCAELVLVENTAQTPYIYTVVRGDTTAMPLHGSNTTTPYDIACGADEFVVGVTGNSSSGGLHALTIHCAPILVSGAPGNYQISYGPKTTHTVAGTNSGGAFSDMLTAPAIVDRIRGRSGAWIDRFGIGEVTLALDLYEPVCGDGVVDTEIGEVCDRGAANGQPLSCSGDVMASFGSHVYCHDLDLLGYGAARSICEGDGGYLVVIDDMAENLFMRDFATAQGSDTPWLGASDFVTEGVWVWANGEPMVFENWAPGYPMTSNEDCLQYAAAGSAQWTHALCGSNRRYTCEFDTPCNADCSYPGFCGDGLVDAGLGEQCDDANVSDGDGCSATCQTE